MNQSEIKTIIDYLTHLEEVLRQLGSWTQSDATAYNLTHCEKYHLSRYTLQGLTHQKTNLIAIYNKMPDEEF